MIAVGLRRSESAAAKSSPVYTKHVCRTCHVCNIHAGTVASKSPLLTVEAVNAVMCAKKVASARWHSI